MRPHPLEPHPEVRLEPLSPRVTVAYGPLNGERWQANATIVVGDRATAVVDAMMTPAQTAPVRAEAERLAAGRPVRWVLLTHADPDHVLGRSTFNDAARPADGGRAAAARRARGGSGVGVRAGVSVAWPWHHVGTWLSGRARSRGTRPARQAAA